MADLSDDTWMVCSACRRPIGYRATHWVCSVSTCNRNRMRLVFCSVACWDAHLADARHRDAWAVEARAPSRDEWASQQAAEPAPPAAARPPAPSPAPAPGPAGAPRRVVSAAAPAPSGPALATEFEREILIVVSKLKKYIKDRSGMNTSDSVADALSDHVRALCDDAIRAAATDNRKTVLDRDVPRPRR